ncbi:MurR/RpiR family transcriptional regulator [Actinomyces sp. F1_1611]
MTEEAALSVRIRRGLPDLQPAIRRVGEIIVADPNRAAAMPITELARAAQTSETTVIRFCRAFGYPGYPQLRLALAAEGRPDSDENSVAYQGDILPEDDIDSVVKKIAYADVTSVSDTANSLSLETLSEVVARVVRANRIEIYGVGASALVAADFQGKLHRIGLTAFSYADPHGAAVSAALANEQTVAFGFSHSGRTSETCTLLQLAQERGATAVAITNSPLSPLAELADLTLLTAARETTFRAGATSSRLAQLTVVDCLFVAIAQQTFDRSIDALEATLAAVGRLRSQGES